ncbi:MAG: TIGR02757 family protein, partial [Thermodesulfovibrionales bacterium]|nr:TIGR02757 family protein [Thermodesulfovibrionales bacterium]
MRKRPALKRKLDALYKDYDFRGRLENDPISLPARYKDKADIEAAGLIASSLAYGRVGLFLPKATELLDRMGEHPALFAAGAAPADLLDLTEGISYRFQLPADLAAFIYCIGGLIREFGGLEAAFMEGMSPEAVDTGEALARFMGLLAMVDTSAFYGGGRRGDGGSAPSRGLRQLMPSPATGGAAKRGCLFLRWMVRGADIDFGLWQGVGANRLVIPLDTHIMRVSQCLGFTKRKSPGWATAVEITRSLRALEPDDPLKYDFALCH